MVPVYSLEAAAGFWGPETVPQEMGWAEAGDVAVAQGMFIAKVRGRSMEPKILDGSWCLFRPCPIGSREGRILLVQFNTAGDVETGGRFTVKKYHSRKVVTEAGWTHQSIELRPINPTFGPIVVGADDGEEMMVVGEFVCAVG